MSKLSFNNNGQVFFASLKKSVEEYFTSKGIKKTGNWKLYSKTLILFPLAIANYCFLLFGSYSTFAGVLLCIVMGFTLVSIAFNVMHDACHRSYSSRDWVNELLSLTTNALGSNAFIWKLKHNIIHHTYTNIDGIDEDISNSPFLRSAPTQKRLYLHRFQHIYMFFLYAISILGWLYFNDFKKYFRRRIVVTEMKMPVKEHFLFWISKLLYIGFYVVLPIFMVGFIPWLVGYMIIMMVLGLVMTIIFQLAHVVEKTSFEHSHNESRQVLETEWAVHEIKTTANFAPKNKIISWFVGGLNFQVEHHLFPRISHIHYPAISKIVQQHCQKFNLPYHVYDTTRAAVASHIRLMKQFGQGNFAA